MLTVKLVVAIGIGVMGLCLITALLGSIISSILEKFNKDKASEITDIIVTQSIKILLYIAAFSLASIFILKAYDMYLNM